MKKVLLISYLFPPNTTIVSSARPYSWFIEFEKHGLKPTVVTRHWDSTPSQNVESLLRENTADPVEEMMNGNRVIYLPYINSRTVKFYEWLKRKKALVPLSLLVKFYLMIIGVVTEEADINFSFKKHIEKVISNEKFDIVVATALPVSALKLLYHLKKTYNIPVVIDFRDYWNLNKMNENFKFSWRAKVYFFIEEFHIKRWLKKMDGIVSVSDPILNKISRNLGVKRKVIFNGYEQNLYGEVVEESNKQKFRITILGALYPTQDLDFMIKGFYEFLKDKDPLEVEIDFIGLKYFPDVASKVQNSLPAEFLKVTARIDRKEAVSITYNSDVLFYIGWKGFKGIYSGKIFEYLGARKNILIAPGDKDVLEDLINETKSGKIANTTDEMIGILDNWFNEFKSNGKLRYEGKEDKIFFYTRENQAKRFSEFLLSEML